MLTAKPPSLLMMRKNLDRAIEHLAIVQRDAERMAHEKSTVEWEKIEMRLRDALADLREIGFPI